MHRICWIMIAGCMAVLCSAEETVYPAVNEEPAGTPVGVRPYEMDWAKRFEPEHPQLVDFENLDGWLVRCMDGAKATLYRSRQKLLFGEYTARVEYTGESHNSRFIIEPPEPIAISKEFTGVNLWMHGNTWSFIRNQNNAMVAISVLVRDAAGRNFSIPMDPNNADYWFLSHCTCVSPDGSKVMYLAADGSSEHIQYPASFTGIEVRSVHNKKTEALHFDALQFYVMDYAPLEFEPLPEDLPWPTTPDTMLPSLKTPVAMEMHLTDTSCTWRVSGNESILFTYAPKTGTLDDITIQADGQQFLPCANGGILFDLDGEAVHTGDYDTTATLVSFASSDRGCKADWELTWKEKRVRYAYEFMGKGKSLIIDVTVEGGDATRLDIGNAKGLPKTKAVYFPYLTYGEDWPRVVCAPGSDMPVFLWAACDYYNSDASELFGIPAVSGTDTTGYTGGALYKPTTAGVRNPMRERIFVNVSADVQEVLPNIPNPDSDMGQVAREYLWRNMGPVHQREALSKFKAYGIDKFIACHHEVGWREGGESFTLRDKPADSIGAEALAEYGAFVKGLGYHFGTYTNYVDYAPVNANWDEDCVNLNPDGTWQRAWPRCYALKPLRAAEFEAKYAPLIHERYGANAQYCDVHTAYTPWGRTDYDARTPGAGKFRTQFDAFARLLYNESKAYGGPVFSEGNYHWFYAGIVDGNYATMLPYGGGWKVDPLVDFDLLKMHTKMTDFGMGFGEMFYGFEGEWKEKPGRLNPWFDRFTASTIAFGHIGFLTYEWGFEATVKGYYQLQALQKRYAQIPVKEIRYFDGTELLDTSAAILSEAYKRRHIYVAYDNGLQVWVNLNHLSEDWSVELNGVTYLLPPTGFLAYKPDDILTYSAILDKQRHELVQCEDYLYFDSRDAFVRTDAIATKGSVAVKPESDNTWWIIPITKTEEVSISREWLNAEPSALFKAQACNEAGETIMEADVRHGEKWITIMPVSDPNIMKYRLQRQEEQGAVWHAEGMPETTLPGAALRVELEGSVNVGDTVNISMLNTDGTVMPLVEGTCETKNNVSLNFQLPEELNAGKRYWFRCATDSDTAPCWLDTYTVSPIEIKFLSDGKVSRYDRPLTVETALTSNLLAAATVKARLTIGIQAPLTQSVQLTPGKATSLSWEVPQPDSPMTQSVTLEVSWAGQQVQAQRFLRMEPAEKTIADLMALSYTVGQCLRGEPERPYNHLGTNALVSPCREVINEVSLDCLHVHPPWGEKTGYTFTTWAVNLPEEPAQLEFALGFRSGSTTQDGCVFQVLVVDRDQETEVFSEQYQDLSTWANRMVDLTPWAGKSVQVKMITDAGPADNSYSDWALWGVPRIVVKTPMVQQHLMKEAPLEMFELPPDACADLSEQDLHQIAYAYITLETAGVDGGQYKSYMYFNGVPIGVTPPSGGDMEWKPGTIVLTSEALTTLGPLNTVIIKNPNSDYMKVRRFCLHLELKNGRTCSSYIALGPWSSDTGWAHTEGLAVSVGYDLPTIRLDMPMKK